jgi:hypothetical protein
MHQSEWQAAGQQVRPLKLKPAAEGEENEEVLEMKAAS